ncbi:MAG: type II secretion system F family protein [candidate division SR1 bacterium]|nr:type II secretion system F family protein [candidate division SR1 bacterium]
MEIQVSKADAFEKFIIRKFYAPKLKNKTNFFRLLALAQRAGLGIRDSLVSIKKSETSKGLILIIEDLIDQLTQGYKLSQAMQNHDYFFKEDEVALVESAETMGNLPEVLQQTADELENTQRINQKITKAATYPAILVLFSIIAVIILLIFVIPTIVTMFPSQDALPSLTKFMLGASGFFKSTRYLLIIIAIGLVALYKFLYKYMLGFKMVIDKLMIVIPAVGGVTKTFYMYKFTRLLGQLYGAGISPILSLKLIGNSFTNFFYKKKMIEIKANLKAGFSFAESMEGSSLFDPILIQIVHVGEETGNIGEVTRKMSEYYRDLLQTKIDILMSFLEPILMALIAIVIGVIVGSIFLPMADLVNVIK